MSITKKELIPMLFSISGIALILYGFLPEDWGLHWIGLVMSFGVILISVGSYSFIRKNMEITDKHMTFVMTCWTLVIATLLGVQIVHLPF